MITATILGEEQKFEDGATFLQAAKMYQDRFEDDILLACADGNLRELWKEIPDGSAVSFRTGADDSGRRTYQRSAIFLMLKAFHDVIGTRKIEKITIEFSIGNGLYGEAKGDFVLDDGLISRVKTRMKELAAAKIPIEKRSVNTDDAVRLFHKYGMYDKEKLFHYRRVSRVNIYSLERYEDYFTAIWSRTQAISGNSTWSVIRTGSFSCFRKPERPAICRNLNQRTNFLPL